MVITQMIVMEFKFYNICKNKLLTNTKKIQKWYQRYQLPDNLPPRNITRKTLHRPEFKMKQKC